MLIGRSLARFGMATALCILTALGCGKPAAQPQPADKATSVEVLVEAGPRINPSPSGEPLSVVVRLYQLKELDELKKLTFEKACQDRTGAEFFGGDFVKESTASEFSVVPGSSKTHLESLQPSTRYVAVVALFRQPDPYFWRVVVQARDLRPQAVQEAKGFWKKEASTAVKPTSIRLKVNDNHIAVEGATRVLLPGQPEGGRPLN